jgi:hypothetical protein
MQKGARALKGQRELTTEADDVDAIKRSLQNLENNLRQRGALKPANQGC